MKCSSIGSSLCISLLVLLFACKPKNSFVGAGQVGDNLRPAVNLTSAQSETFANRFFAKADVIFVVDNSPSMANEIAQVRTNIYDFLRELKLKSDVSTALISRRSPPVVKSNLGDTTLSLGGDVSRQINVEVGSKNALAILAASLCSSTETDVSGINAINTICAMPVGPLESPENVQAVRGLLSTFLRPDARLFFVFVSDDDAGNLNDNAFATLLSNRFKTFWPVTYAFTGLEKRADSSAKSSAELLGNMMQSTCAIASPGLGYKRLADRSGGQVFDICKTDWRPPFVSMQASIVSHLQSTFLLRTVASQIVDIEVDGILQNAQGVVLQGRQVYVPGLSPGYKKITIRYK